MNGMQSTRLGRAAALACALGLILAACGGGSGGSNTRPDPPPTAPPPTPTPPVVGTPNPAYGKHLSLTNTEVAHAAGLTGQGITIGVVDSGINRNHPSLLGRVTANLNYVSSPPNNLSVDDVVGHGTAVSQIIAGKPFGTWPGGVAPGLWQPQHPGEQVAGSAGAPGVYSLPAISVRGWKEHF